LKTSQVLLFFTLRALRLCEKSSYDAQ
jgi:hypothetical protein